MIFSDGGETAAQIETAAHLSSANRRSSEPSYTEMHRIVDGFVRRFVDGHIPAFRAVYDCSIAAMRLGRQSRKRREPANHLVVCSAKKLGELNADSVRLIDVETADRTLRSVARRAFSVGYRIELETARKDA